MPDFTIQDAVAMVTGANRPNGIGRAILDALLDKGAAKVYATARDVSQLDDVVAKYNGKVIPVALDVTDLTSIATLGTLYPDVTILVNNSGIFGENSSIGSVEVAVEQMQINYTGPLAMGITFAPVFAKLGAGTDATTTKTSALVNINSIASLINFPLGGTYSASKAATHSLTQAQRRDFPHTLVIGVYPGMIDTSMTDGYEMPKTSPSTVADEVIEALEQGIEDLYPDPMSKELYNGWKTDAKAVEQNMAAQASSS